MRVIGVGQHIQGLDGCRLVTTELSSTSVTGTEIVAGLSMITAGTGNAKGTVIDTATSGAWKALQLWNGCGSTQLFVDKAHELMGNACGPLVVE
jgi:hypothetical protein